MGENGSHIGDVKVARMGCVVEPDVADHPAPVRLFGMPTELPAATRAAKPVQ